MRLWRKLLAGLFGICFAFVANAAGLQYPSQPIHLIVGYAPGGSTDYVARLLARLLSAELSESIVVENRTGARGMLSNQYVLSSKPDGYTLLMATPDVAYPAPGEQLPYDPERDLTPVGMVVTTSFFLVVNASSPFKTVGDVIKYARENPEKLTYGTAGANSRTHLAGELFARMAGIKLLHVPFRGGSQATSALLGRQIDISFTTALETAALEKAGKVRILAGTSKSRSTILPDIPTLNESGVPGYDFSGWIAVLGPKGISGDIVARLNAVINNVITKSRADFERPGYEINPLSPKQLGDAIRSASIQASEFNQAMQAK